MEEIVKYIIEYIYIYIAPLIISKIQQKASSLKTFNEINYLSS